MDYEKIKLSEITLRKCYPIIIFIKYIILNDELIPRSFFIILINFAKYKTIMLINKYYLIFNKMRSKVHKKL